MKALLLILLIPIMGLGQINQTDKVTFGSDNKHAPIWEPSESVLGKNTVISFATDTLDEGVVIGFEPKEKFYWYTSIRGKACRTDSLSYWQEYYKKQDSIEADTWDEGIVIDLSTPDTLDDGPATLGFYTYRNRAAPPTDGNDKEYPSYILVIRHQQIDFEWLAKNHFNTEMNPKCNWEYSNLTFKSKSDAIEFLERRKTEESEFVALYDLSTAAKIDLKLKIDEKVIKEKVIEKKQVIQEYKWR